MRTAGLSWSDRVGVEPAVVFLHGLAGHAGEWQAVRQGLACRTVALDLRGHGGSERRPEDLSHEGRVADVVAVLDELGLERVVLVGQSLGGVTAMMVAARHPERVAGLVMIEASPGASDPGTPALIDQWLASWPVPFGSRQDAVAFLGEGWADGLEQTAEGLVPRFDRDVMVAMIAEHERRDYWGEWERVQCPVALVLGEKGIIDQGDVRRMGVEPHVVAGAGHDVHLDAPEAVRSLLAAFAAG